MAPNSTELRDARALDAALRAMFRSLQARALPAVVRATIEQLQAQEKRA